MSEVRLREIREADLDALTAGSAPDADPWSFFGFFSANGLRQRFAADGMISEDFATLAVQTADGTLLGTVQYRATSHGPTATCRAWNIGISVLPEHRGQGYGTAAQRELADYLFQTTLAERVEATTDTANIAEQRALEKAGFTREGVLRHAQFRAGQWRDMALYSHLRGDPGM